MSETHSYISKFACADSKSGVGDVAVTTDASDAGNDDTTTAITAVTTAVTDSTSATLVTP